MRKRTIAFLSHRSKFRNNRFKQIWIFTRLLMSKCRRSVTPVLSVECWLTLSSPSVTWLANLCVFVTWLAFSCVFVYCASLVSGKSLDKSHPVILPVISIHFTPLKSLFTTFQISIYYKVYLETIEFSRMRERERVCIDALFIYKSEALLMREIGGRITAHREWVKHPSLTNYLFLAPSPTSLTFLPLLLS